MSNPARTITGKVTGIKRTTSSVNGNPAFFVTIAREDGYEETVRTQTDSMIAYGIENPEYRDERHLFKLTLANRLYGADRLEDFPLDKIPADGSCVNCGNPGAIEGLCSACAADAAEEAALDPMTPRGTYADAAGDAYKAHSEGGML